MELRLVRRYRFPASHLLRRAEWSDEENWRRFGKCSNTPGHGHNYRLIVTVAGLPDAETGFVVDLAVLDEWVHTRVVSLFDHRHVNHAIPEFGPGGKVPSTEEMLGFMHARLAGTEPAGARLVGLRLEEDDDLAAEWAVVSGP